MKYSYNYCIDFLNAGTVNEVWHCHFLHSLGLYAENVTLRIRNALYHDFAIAVDGFNFNADIQHMTGHTCWWDFTSGLGQFQLWNSLMSDVPLPPNYTPPSHVAWYASEQPGLFATVGSGAHYLANAAHRNGGVETIDPTLKNDLGRMTTIAPTVLSGNVTSNLFLAPTPIGDLDTPDRGYHYPGVHFAANVTLNNHTALLTNGVVIATFGQDGFWLKGGSELVSEGKPGKLNQIIPYQLVQEGSTYWEYPIPWAIQTFNLMQWSSTLPDPRVTLRFTHVDRHLDGGYQLFAGDPYRIAHLEVRDSRLVGGQFIVSGSADYIPKLGVTNTVFENVHLDFLADPDLYFYNNLFLSCPSEFERWESGYPGGGNWIVADNIFDRCIVTGVDDPWTGHQYNAYVSSTRNTWPLGTGEFELTSLAYETGIFGKYYLPATATSLINQGSRTAAEAGLFHYTTSEDINTKEGTQEPPPYKVDIGAHYVGVNITGQPIDSDGSAVPDYVEDRNGNGLYDPGPDALVGETDWQAQFDIIANFPGIRQKGESETYTPDTIGAAGPNHFMMVLNEGEGGHSVAVFDKATGVRVSPVTSLGEFFFLNVPGTDPNERYRGDHPRLGSGLLAP